jgi:hypothetical protein
MLQLAFLYIANLVLSKCDPILAYIKTAILRGLTKPGTLNCMITCAITEHNIDFEPTLIVV